MSKWDTQIVDYMHAAPCYDQYLKVSLPPHSIGLCGVSKSNRHTHAVLELRSKH